MKFLPILLVAAATFGLCFLADKSFARLFRSKAQHRTGKSVRNNKRTAAIGLILIALGIAAIFGGDSLWMRLCGGIVILFGCVLVAQYLCFGIFYDDDSFLVTSFPKRSVTYRFEDILAQQLYNNQGHILIELHMKDGKTVHIQSQQEGAYAFLDHAFAAWLRQTGRRQADCTFYDPQNSCWFPPVGEE